ncbi:RNA-binding S4 domain-containing protein [Methylocapsa sp. S129]|uniref:RNA-binding S4 domain-containing protein n=1 Tax=Methylocapsa sp. S129 TaxID=1641869 RepID=UPI00131CE467|nr:RNA-binding S4 domain-containing protein [Methylocapsa sp. S129]
MSEAAEACRIDVWLWRARFFKTRGLAARAVAEGSVRLLRGGARIRLDKPGRTLRPGDGLLLTLGDRQVAMRIEALGTRRGPAPEARALYSVLDELAPGGKP